MNKILKNTLIGTSLVGLVYLGNISINLATYYSSKLEYNKIKQGLESGRRDLLRLYATIKMSEDNKSIKIEESKETRLKLEELTTKLDTVEILADTGMKEIKKGLDYAIKPWLYLKEK